MARWARSRGGGGEGRGRAPQPFRGSSPSPALARPLARARALPSGSSSLPGPAGRCAFAPFPRYLGRRTPPPPRRSSSVCHRSCPNALTSPRCRRPRPARKRGGERRRWGACAGWAEPGPRSLLQGGLGAAVPRAGGPGLRRGRRFSRSSARCTLGKSSLSDCWGSSQTLSLLWPSFLCPGGPRVPGCLEPGQAAAPFLPVACGGYFPIPPPTHPGKDGGRLVGLGQRAIEVKRQMDCLVSLSVTDFQLEGIACRCDSAILFLSHTHTSEILETDVHRKTWNFIPTRHVCVLLHYELKEILMTSLGNLLSIYSTKRHLIFERVGLGL